MASSSARCSPRCEIHGDCTENRAATVSISSEHCSSPDTSNAFASGASSGSSAMNVPSGDVSRASRSSAPSACSSSSAATSASAGGGDSQSKLRMLSMPSALSCSTVPVRSDRCISGTGASASDANAASCIMPPPSPNPTSVQWISKRSCLAAPHDGAARVEQLPH